MNAKRAKGHSFRPSTPYGRYGGFRIVQEPHAKYVRLRVDGRGGYGHAIALGLICGLSCGLWFAVHWRG